VGVEKGRRGRKRGRGMGRRGRDSHSNDRSTVPGMTKFLTFCDSSTGVFI
jgi:hypothetical protein